ncbi:conjugal transfer protein TraF [Vibrio chagasii]|nr:conjugal transfer protein TraF [Vibrio chagasii]
MVLRTVPSRCCCDQLVLRDIETKDTTRTLTSSTSGATHQVGGKYAYQLEPVYTVGAGIVSDYFSLSVDYDLNETEKVYFV